MKQRILTARLMVFFGALALAEAACIVFAIGLPKNYAARCIIELRLESPPGFSVDWDIRRLVRDVCEGIRSQEVLAAVEEKLQLHSRDGVSVELAVRHLEENVSATRIAGTAEVEINARDREQLMAVQIANAVADEYEAAGLTQARERTQRGVDKLKELMGEQQKRITHAQQEVERLCNGTADSACSNAQKTLSLEQGLYTSVTNRLEQASHDLASGNVHSPVRVIQRASAATVTRDVNFTYALSCGATIGATAGALLALGVGLVIRRESSGTTVKRVDPTA